MIQKKNKLNLKKSSAKSSVQIPQISWRILVVDDDEGVHTMTRLILEDIHFENRPIEMLSAYSGKDARALLTVEKNISIILLDVVMETDDAGLQLIHFIREELKDKNSRIILRTGQAGQAPEGIVVEKYDINDYKAKSELTSQKLSTLIITSLRAYKSMLESDEAILSLSKTREDLEKIIAEANEFPSW
ncbi:MAG: response regulator [Methylococcaceae bacterium]